MDEINRNMERIFKKLECIERKIGVLNIQNMTLDEKVSELLKVDKKNENEEIQEKAEAGPSSYTCHICGHTGLKNKSEWIKSFTPT